MQTYNFIFGLFYIKLGLYTVDIWVQEFYSCCFGLSTKDRKWSNGHMYFQQQFSSFPVHQIQNVKGE